VKGIALNVEGGHLSGGDLDTFLISVGVQFALDGQTGRCGRGGNQWFCQISGQLAESAPSG
jgi:hypothetical protein